MNLYNKWDDIFFRFHMHSINHGYNTILVDETSVNAEIHHLRTEAKDITHYITKQRIPQSHIDHEIIFLAL